MSNVIEWLLSLRDEATTAFDNAKAHITSGSKETATAVNAASQAFTGQQREVSKLTQFIREQRTEQREHTFLFSQGREVVGAASIALGVFSNATGSTDEAMKKLSNSLNQGFITFQGLSFAIGNSLGPWGAAASIAAGLAATLFSMGNESADTKQKIRDLDDQINKLKHTLGETTDAQNKASLKKNLDDDTNALAKAQGAATDWVGVLIGATNVSANLKSVWSGQFGKELFDALEKFGTEGVVAVDNVNKKTKESSEEIKKHTLAVQQDKKAVKDGADESVRLQSEVNKANIEADTAEKVSHAKTMAEKIKAEKDGAIAVIDELERVVRATVLEDEKQKPLLDKLEAEKRKIRADAAVKIVEDEKRVNEEIARLESERVKIATEASSEVFLAIEKNTQRRIDLIEYLATAEANQEEADQLKTTTNEEKKTQIHADFEAKRLKIAADAVTARINEEDRSNQSIQKMDADTASIKRRTQEEIDLAAAKSAEVRLEIEKKYNLDELRAKYETARAEILLKADNAGELKSLDQRYAASYTEITTRASLEITKIIEDNFKMSFGKGLEFANQAFADLDSLLGGQSQEEIARLQKQSDATLKDIDKRKAADLKSIDDRKTADLRAIDLRLKSETLSTEERKKLELDRFNLENSYADATAATSKKYDDERTKQEAAFNAKISQAKHDEAVTHKEIAIVESIINTALAVTRVLAETGPVAPFIIPSIVALGVAETAIIAGQAIPEFHEGGEVDLSTGAISQAEIAKRVENASASEEFKILVQGGETIRTVAQEKDLNIEILNLRSGLIALDGRQKELAKTIAGVFRDISDLHSADELTAAKLRDFIAKFQKAVFGVRSSSYLGSSGDSLAHNLDYVANHSPVFHEGGIVGTDGARALPFTGGLGESLALAADAFAPPVPISDINFGSSISSPAFSGAAPGRQTSDVQGEKMLAVLEKIDGKLDRLIEIEGTENVGEGLSITNNFNGPVGDTAWVKKLVQDDMRKLGFDSVIEYFKNNRGGILLKL